MVFPQGLAVALGRYEQYAAGQLSQLARDVAALRTAITSGDPARARTAWLTAQLCWDRVGAAYGSFGEHGDAIDGLPQGLSGGTGDADFTGLHRIEYGLWHGESVPGLLAIVDRLAADVDGLRGSLHENLPGPIDLPLRAHEVLEDALRDHSPGSPISAAAPAWPRHWRQ